MTSAQVAAVPLRSSWLGVLVPPAAALAALLLVALLAAVVQLDQASVPKPNFRAHLLAGYPDASAPGDAALVVESLLWWLCLSVLSWVAGLGAIGLCLLQLRRASGHDPALRRLALRLLPALLLTATLGLAYAVLVLDKALMPVRPLVELLDVVGSGLPRLASLNTALAYVVALALVVSTSLLLAPGACASATGSQFRAITLLMYGAALFLLAWIATAAAMYRLAACLLVPGLRTPVLSVAPTVSLMGGLFLSLVLAAVYSAAATWLQHCHEQAGAGAAPEGPGGDGAGPLALLATHWPKVVGVLLPALPGIVGSVVQAMTQAQ